MEKGDLVFNPEWWATLGVGGILAGVMFFFYRKDIKQYTELWRMTAEMLMATIKENTASNMKLITMIENMERNQMRRSDIALIKNQLHIPPDDPHTRKESHPNG